MNYTCPYCGTHTTITEPNHHKNWGKIWIKPSTLGETGFGIECVTCPNIECNKMMLKARITKTVVIRGNSDEGRTIETWRLLPSSEAKVIPDYIPLAIQEDYYEACKIRDLSPKASATLSRRCLQGMIRDFYKITKPRLIDEIKALEGVVEPDVWESIDAVRTVGNIGAHMEKDIDLIVDVEPEEAQLLISLIEQLIEDWYIARESRRVRAEGMKALASKKAVQKTGTTDLSDTEIVQ